MAKEIYGKMQKSEDKYTIVASTGMVDRDDEIILPSAFKNLKSFLKDNPVILWAHNYGTPPIGKAVDGKITDEALVLNIEFAETEFGKEVKYLYDNGFMNSFSVGFIPKDWERDPDGKLVFTDVELLETSAVPVPANAQANIIRTAKSAGMELTEVEKLFTAAKCEQTPEPKGGEEKQAESQAERNKKLYGGIDK